MSEPIPALDDVDAFYMRLGRALRAAFDASPDGVTSSQVWDIVAKVGDAPLQSRGALGELSGDSGALRNGDRAATSAGADGASRIASERFRQINIEGRLPSADHQYDLGQLVDAAICYAEMASALSDIDRSMLRRRPTRLWPWGDSWWKPGTDDSAASRIRELEKAGALIAAEIDRLLAATPLAGKEE